MLVMVCRIFCNRVGRWSLAEVCINQNTVLCLDGEVPITKPITLDALLSHSPGSEWQHGQQGKFSLLWSMYVHAQDCSTYIWCGAKESSFQSCCC